jgi:steroid delta-isomerase-like uncharacterized protein
MTKKTTSKLITKKVSPGTDRKVTSGAQLKIARLQVDAFNRNDWEQMQGALASNSRYNEFGSQRKIRGSAKIVELFRGWKKAFPDAKGTITSAVSSGNQSVLEVTWKGTQTGPLEANGKRIPPSGKRQVTPAAFFFTFEGDKITESRQYFDSMTLLTQIGEQPIK